MVTETRPIEAGKNVCLHPAEKRVRCGRCKWDGWQSQLREVPVALHDDVNMELGCPSCYDDSYLEFEE